MKHNLDNITSQKWGNRHIGEPHDHKNGGLEPPGPIGVYAYGYQKGKTNLDITETRDSDWQWHQLGRMQVCTSLQTDDHASTPPISFYRPDALLAAQPTASKY